MNKKTKLGVLIVIINIIIFEYWAEIINAVKSNWIGIISIVGACLGFIIFGMGIEKTINNKE